MTHDQDDAFAIADRMAVLREGKLLQIGAPDELYRRPTSIHVADFIGRATLVAARRVGEKACITLNGVTQYAPVASMPNASAGDDSVLAVIRPEMLDLCPPESADGWRGHVDSCRYAGAYYVYRVSVPALPGADRTYTFEIESEEGCFREEPDVGVKLMPRPLALVSR